MQMRRSGKRRLLSRVLASAGVLGVLGACGGLVYTTVADRTGGAELVAQPAPTKPDGGNGASVPRAKKPTKPRVATPVRLVAVGAHDPSGDGREEDERAPAATDRNPATAWRTERYRQFAKDGVGLVLDAGKPVTLRRLLVSTATPGFTAEVLGGNARKGPFTRVATGKRMVGKTTFALRPSKSRYYVLWITAVADGTAAEIAEVQATR